MGIQKLLPYFTAKSPVFGMINSTMSGLSTIRCCNSQGRLLTNFDNAQVCLLYKKKFIVAFILAWRS